MTRHRLLSVAAAAAMIAVVASFLGWGRSGSSVRSSYGLFQAADRAGLLPESLAGAGVLFLFVPVVVGAALIALTLERPRIAAWGFIISGFALTVAAVLVVRSPLGVEIPAVVAGGAGTLAATASAVALIIRSNAGGRRA